MLFIPLSRKDLEMKYVNIEFIVFIVKMGEHAQIM